MDGGDAIEKAELAVRKIIADRVAHAELPTESLQTTFNVAA